MVAIPRTLVNGVPVPGRCFAGLGMGTGDVAAGDVAAGDVIVGPGGDVVTVALAEFFAATWPAVNCMSVMGVSFLDQGPERQSAADTEQCDEDTQQTQPRPTV
jgi:hypothetical protein